MRHVPDLDPEGADMSEATTTSLMFMRQVVEVEAERDALTAENQRLRAWKAEAMAVLAEWDAVHEALGSPGKLGESKAAASRAKAFWLRGASALDGGADTPEATR